MLVYQICKPLQVRAVIIQRYRMDDRLVQGECLDRTEIPGPFHPEMVARVEEDLCHKIQALLGPVHDLDLVSLCGDPEAAPVPVGDVLPERQVPVSRAVLEGHPPLLFDHLAGRPGEPVGVNEPGGGEPPGKRDDPGL